MTDQTAFWNERYAREGYLFGEEPNDFLRAVAPSATAGKRAYAPADGEGRNGVFLASLGYSVTSVDVSQHAVEKAKQLAERRGVQLDARVGSLFDFDGRDFDLIAVSFMHFWPEDRIAFHRKLVEALAPGGLLIFESYSIEQLNRGYRSGGPGQAEMLLTVPIVSADFADLSVVLCQEVTRELSEGTRHQGPAATIQLVARKS